MRILHVIQELRTGGAERIVVSLARGAAAQGHEVAVAAALGPLEAELGGPRFSVPLLRRRPWLVPSAVRGVRRALRAWRPDVVHCHNPGMAVVTSLATLRGRRPPSLVSVHGVPDPDWAATARVLRLSGLPVVACGPGVAVALAEHGRPAATTIANAVGAPPPPVDRAVLERELGLPPGRPLAVVAGRLVAAKNVGLAIEAVAALPDVSLAILGEGPLLNELRAHVERLDARGRIVLAGLRADARAIIGTADALVVSSLAEGLPMVVLEAFAAGTPVVATAVRGTREVILDGRDGLLVPPGDAAALAGALRRVLVDKELAATLADGGRALAAGHTEEQMVAAFLELYARLAA